MYIRPDSSAHQVVPLDRGFYRDEGMYHGHVLKEPNIERTGWPGGWTRTSDYNIKRSMAPLVNSLSPSVEFLTAHSAALCSTPVKSRFANSGGVPISF